MVININEIKIKDKSLIEIESIKKIVAITPTKVTLELDYSSITIHGANLEMIKINESQTAITLKGTISELVYDNAKIKSKDNILKKLFT